MSVAVEDVRIPHLTHTRIPIGDFQDWHPSHIFPLIIWHNLTQILEDGDFHLNTHVEDLWLPALPAVSAVVWTGVHKEGPRLGTKTGQWGEEQNCWRRRVSKHQSNALRKEMNGWWYMTWYMMVYIIIWINKYINQYLNKLINMYIYTCTYIHILLILHVSNITLGHRRFVLYTAHRFLGFGLMDPAARWGGEECLKHSWRTAYIPRMGRSRFPMFFFLLLLPHVVWILVFMRPFIYSMILWIIHYHILWHLFPRNQRLKCRNCTCLLPLRFDPFLACAVRQEANEQLKQIPELQDGPLAMGPWWVWGNLEFY